MNVGQYLETISESVLAQTKMIRASFTNSSNKGHGFEIIIRDLLDEYTANSNFVNHGEIIDSFGSKTGQIDFAILENLHPSGSTDGRPRILLFDAVHAVGECKLLLNTGELDLIINANQNFRKLKISKAVCQLADDRPKAAPCHQAQRPKMAARPRAHLCFKSLGGHIR